MNTPKIRFKGFKDDWEQRKLIDYLDVSNEKNKKGDYKKTDVLSVSGEVGIVNQIEFQGRSFAGVSVENYGIVNEGDVVYTKSPLKANPYGIIKTNKGKAGIVSTLYAVYKPKENTDSNFVQIYFELDSRMNSYMHPLVNKGAKNDMKVSDENALKGNVTFPKINEQKAISNFITELDHLITLHQRKCDETKQLKKFMLQKMFPKNGEKNPEIRFEGFTDDWEQRKFGNLADYKKGPFGSAVTKDMFVPKSDDSVKVYEQQNAINKDWSLERYFLPNEYALTKLKSFEVHGGDIIVSCAGTIGEIYEIPEDAEVGIINQALMRVRVNESIVDKKMFIIAFSNMIDVFSRTHSNGSAIKNIPPFADLKPMGVMMPSMDEQQKVSGYFEKIDNLITLHQRKCEKLKELKKYMLRNMFI